MISGLLLPGFASGAPGDVLLRTAISAHPCQADHVQRTIGLPVAYSRLRRWLTTLPEEASMGATPHRLSEGGLAPQPLGVVFKATIKSVAALSVPMPGRATNSGATCATSRARGAPLARLSPPRGPGNGRPPNAARTW
jgi:hypothetical protein